MPEPVSIKDYVDAAHSYLQHEIDGRFENLYRQLDAAKDQLDSRLDAMNEFRAALTELTGTLVTRQALEQALERMRDDHKRYEADIDAINASLQQARGRQLAYTSIFAGVLAALAVLSYLFNGSLIHIH